MAPAADHIIVLHPFQEKRNVGRVVLQIGIEGNDNFPPGGFESGHECCGLAMVVTELDKPDAWIVFLHGFDHMSASIDTSIINKNNDLIRKIIRF